MTTARELIARRLTQMARISSRPRAALDIAALSLRGRFRQARVCAAAAARRSSPTAEKVISRRYRFVWLCVPKAASRSLIAALAQADPDAEIVRKATISEIRARRPETRGYFTFAFVRHPFDRALSLYAEARHFRERFVGSKRRVKAERQRFLESAFPGFAEVDTLDDFCDWLNSPYAADEFADVHFLSQRPQIAASDGALPDFIGAAERLDDDFRAVCERLGMPAPSALPALNTAAGWNPPSPRALMDARAETRALLTERNKTLLTKRYADDIELHRAVLENRTGGGANRSQSPLP